VAVAPELERALPLEASVDTLEPALERAAADFASQRRESTFTIFADPYGPAAELSGLRQSFTAASITHGLSVDRRHGIVTLAPEGISLRVGSEADEYQRIRIVDEAMELVGTMSCSPDGTVTWRVP
jgi:hypothetical protein